jgi:DEAD/DEAH box helicase domain-containing protein
VARLDAIELSRSLENRLVDFSVSSNFLRNEQLEEVCRRIWSGDPDEGGLCSDLWVESAIPPRSSDHTLESLAAEGILDRWLTRLLDKSGIFPADRNLYLHQAESIYACQSTDAEQPAVILTAGTGSGKTESFLLPVLSSLAKTKRKPHEGCRAIILYPMNALVNDQVERLYSWLKGQKELSVCHFTGETPENHRLAEKHNYPRFEACRHRTRQRARGLETFDGTTIKPENRTEPPDILITNYSMLEYMLCRPQDTVFFGPGLQAVVLDEAHLYTGTLAAEITLLLRRLYDKCGVTPAQVLQFATSATIGTGSKEELQDFASTLFSKPKDRVAVIQGRKAEPSFPSPEEPTGPFDHGQLQERGFHQRTIIQKDDGTEALLQSAEACQVLQPLLSQFVDPKRVERARQECSDQPARLLLALQYSKALQTVDKVLRDQAQISLHDLTQQVWGRTDQGTIRATTELLGLASAARDSLQSTPLLPHRLHLMLRPADGLHVCLNPDCCGPEDRRYEGLGTVLSNRPDQCPHCEHQCLAIFRCMSCGQECLAAQESTGYLQPPRPFQDPQVVLCCDPSSDTTLDPKRGCYGQGPVKVRILDACENCEADLQSLSPMDSANSLVLSILAETLLTNLPPLPTIDERSNTILPARGRRLLAFSDSRAEAARLGPRLRRQHDFQMIRAAIVRLFEAQPSVSQDEVEALDADIQDLQQKLAEPSAGSAAKGRREKQLLELQKEREAMTVGGTVAHWADLLREHEADVLSEVLEEDLGERHQASEWNQLVWTQNSEAARAKAEEFLGNEMARLPRRHSLTVETIGAVEVTYPGLAKLKPPSAFLGGLPTQKLREALSDAWLDLLVTSCDLLRSGGAVTFGSWEKDLEWQQERVPIGQWMTLDKFRGKTERGLNRRFARYVLKCAGAEGSEEALDALAKELLTALFECLLEMATDTALPAPGQERFPWLQKDLRVFEDKSDDGLQLIFPLLALRKPHAHYLCSKTGHVWPRSVLGCAPESGSCGTLYAVTEDELNQSAFVGRARREYTSDSPIFKLGLWAEEHSAQLSMDETRRLQELFQRGMRNVLSATTTLELGIDIGGLSGAFLSNVPPGKANYLQRAGRVGRRADGSSVVVTCARSRPYDREVFHRIGDFLARPLRQPKVFLERDRIARRHFHSWLMSEFFAQLYKPEARVGAMQAFGRMGQFCGVRMPEKWRRDDIKRPKIASPVRGEYLTPSWWDCSATEGLIGQYKSWVRYAAQADNKQSLDVILRGTSFQKEADRSTLFEDAESLFSKSLSSWLEDYDGLMKTWSDAKDAGQANAIRYQLFTLYRLTVIETLSDARYLPRYGFPIGVHKLRVVVPDDEKDRRGRTRIRQEDQFRLERSSLLALREYVPGSQLLVGGKLITSHGLLKHWTGANVDNAFGLRGGSTKCPNDHYYYWIAEKPEACPLCDEKSHGPIENLMFPSHGFTTAPWDPPKRSVDTDRVGVVVAATTAFTTKAKGERRLSIENDDFAEVPFLKATYKEEGELMVFNRGDNNQGFAICTACGYAESEPEKENAPLPRSFQVHKPLFGDQYSKPCFEIFQNPTILHHQNLAAREPTDIVMIDPSHFLEPSQATQVVTSLAVALKLAGARLLQLDSRELGNMVVPAGHSGRSFGAVIYDTMPGGAGHCLELMQMGRQWLEAARKLLRGTPEHNQRCQRACLDCLMTFDAQALFESTGVTLDRRVALDFLDRILDGEEERPPSPPVENPTGLPEIDLREIKDDPEKQEQLTNQISELPDDRFAVQIPTGAVDRIVPTESWCIFRRLHQGEEVPRNEVVLVFHADIQDADLGTVTIRRYKSQDFADADGRPTKKVVTLSPRSHDRKRYDSYHLELREPERSTWRPLAILERTHN